MNDELNPPSESEVSSLSEQEIIFRLAAIGANSSNNSYDGRIRPLTDRFISLDLKTMFYMWDFLDDKVKLRILNKNKEKFREWILSQDTGTEAK